MSESNRKQDLREISHLFLSSVRQRQTGNAAPPRRIAPAQRTDSPVDLTPEEIAHVAGMSRAQERGLALSVTVVLGSHFESSLSQRAGEYAAHLARSAGRVGLVEADSRTIAVTVFDSAANSIGSDHLETSSDARRLAGAMNELARDVDHWLLALPATRLAATHDLMQRASRFVLLSECDADGVVSAYRTLKGAADILRRGGNKSLPALSLALLNAADDRQAAAVFDKISSVTLQFLSWPIEMESRVGPARGISRHAIIQAVVSPGDSGDAAHWRVLTDFLNNIATSTLDGEELTQASIEQSPPDVADESPLSANSIAMSTATLSDAPILDHKDDDVLEVVGADDHTGILHAVISGSPSVWIECPVRPPMCPDARLAISRDRTLTLLAVPSRGLHDLRAIGEAYQWLQQNRALVAMALPQLAIDAHQLPRLQLFVDHADFSAETLKPLLHARHVSVTAYRKIRWSGRRGLLLDAA
jgi:hypothetical protein